MRVVKDRDKYTKEELLQKMALCRYTFEKVNEYIADLRKTQAPIITLLQVIEGTDKHTHSTNNCLLGIATLKMVEAHFDAAENLIARELGEMIDEVKEREEKDG